MRDKTIPMQAFELNMQGGPNHRNLQYLCMCLYIIVYFIWLYMYM